jgi:uncharacterized damage-inducible protein DinB
MNPEFIQTLIDYNYGEHRKVWDNCVMQLTDEQFTHDSGYSHGSIHAEVVHIMNGEWWWISRAQGKSPQSQPKAAEYPTRADVRARWDEIEAEVRGFVSGLDEATLAAPVHYTTPKGDVIDNHVWKILLHLCNHGTIHRAEIMAISAGMGTPSFDLSFMRYITGGRF